jgi:hypothetical protein
MKILKHSGWMDSFGGPFILASDSDVLSWMGACREGGGDYEDACNASSDYIGVVKKKLCKFIIFGDEPLSTNIISTDIGILFLRWRWANDDFNVIDFINGIDFENLDIVEATSVHLMHGVYYFFDSALPGSTPNKYNLIFEKDIFSVKSYTFEPNHETAFLINTFFY